MDKKNLIISKLEELKKIYQQDADKKWNLRALSIAINAIKTYDKDIISGSQVQSNLKGVGDKISKRIDEILETGTLSELNNYELPNNSFDNLLLITGVGGVRAKKWIKQGIKNINDVRKAIIDKTITTTHHIDVGVKYYEEFQQKIPRKEIDKMKIILTSVIKQIDKTLIFEICGSYRRNLKESGDIDILISNPNKLSLESDYLKKIVEELTKINFIIDFLSEGNTKFMGVCQLNKKSIARRIDIRYVEYESYYTSLIYFTGDREFNIYIRNKALKNNFSINEYCLTYVDGKKVFLTSEKELFDILKIPYISPEKRNNGQFEIN